MAQKEVALAGPLEPLTKPLPASLARAIGQLIARQAYLEWVLGQVTYNLMEISTRQGRVMLKLPRPGQFIGAIRELYDFHGIEARLSLEELARKLDASDRTRTVLTRSTYMRGEKGQVILARSLWDPGPGADTQPDLQVLDDEFFAGCRKTVEAAVASAEKLQSTTNDLLRSLHERRRTQRNLDRRQR
jgi:hypothetical protein